MYSVTMYSVIGYRARKRVHLQSLALYAEADLMIESDNESVLGAMSTRKRDL